jgi:hypothetical protein
MIREEEREQGMECGRREGIQMLIEMGRENGLDDAIILNKLQEKMGLSRETSLDYLAQYGKR